MKFLELDTKEYPYVIHCTKDSIFLGGQKDVIILRRTDFSREMTYSTNYNFFKKIRSHDLVLFHSSEWSTITHTRNFFTSYQSRKVTGDSSNIFYVDKNLALNHCYTASNTSTSNKIIRYNVDCVQIVYLKNDCQLVNFGENYLSFESAITRSVIKLEIDVPIKNIKEIHCIGSRFAVISEDGYAYIGDIYYTALVKTIKLNNRNIDLSCSSFALFDCDELTIYNFFDTKACFYFSACTKKLLDFSYIDNCTGVALLSNKTLVELKIN